MNIYKLEDKAYNASELKAIFDANKTVLTFVDYYEKNHVVPFVLLDQSKPVLVSNYPYGRLRTHVKYSIVSNNYGETLVFQSQNPKTMQWNNPKKGGYSTIGFMAINSEGHIGTISLDYNDSESKIKAFESLFLEHMTQKQKIIFCKITGYSESMKHVTFSCSSRHYKHRETGEIMTSVNMSDLNKVDECDAEGNLKDIEKENQKEKENDDLLNKNMTYNARKKAIEIFKVRK